MLTDNEQAFHDHLGRKLNPSFGLIQIVLGVTNAALMALPEEGELVTNATLMPVPQAEEGELNE